MEIYVICRPLLSNNIYFNIYVITNNVDIPLKIFNTEN